VLVATLLLARAASAGEAPPSALVPAGVPSLAALEKAGATIGRIDVFGENIFDLEDRRENSGLYWLADKLHYRTREHTVRSQLLFKSGDKLSVERLAETERILRARVYLVDAWIVPAGWDPAGKVVDLSVTVRDVWTFDPQVNFGRSGGRNQNSIGLQEENLLGLGTTLQVSHTENVDRTSKLLGYSDNNFNGSWWRLALEYQDNSDGAVKSASFVLPFYSLDSRSAGGATSTDTRSVISRYSEGAILDQVQEIHQQGQVYIGGSRGLIDGWTQRWSAGLTYDDAEFHAVPGMPLVAPLPGTVTSVYPWLGYQLLEDRYVKTENLDLIGRTEDQYLGRSLYAQLGYSSPSWGGNSRSWLYQLNAQQGWQDEDRRYLFLTGALAGRIDDGEVRNLSLTTGGRYFERITDRQVLYAALSTTVTSHLDAENQLLLGGDTGLRGYPIRYQSGTSSALLTLEHRLYTDWYPFRLLRVGSAVFFDAGRTWGRDFAGGEPLGLLRDVGLGLRFGNNRSGLGNVIHVDLSYALDAPAGVRRVEVSASTSQRF
jgi:hemolysin activation/secretion protein